jgi:hypothetical protein
MMGPENISIYDPSDPGGATGIIVRTAAFMPCNYYQFLRLEFDSSCMFGDISISAGDSITFKPFVAAGAFLNFMSQPTTNRLEFKAQSNFSYGCICQPPWAQLFYMMPNP